MLELIEIGFLEGFFTFSVQPLNLLIWAGVLLGFLIQYLALKKARRAWVKWIFPSILLAGAAVSECMTWAITGWDLFGVLIIYWGILCLAIGAGAAWIAHKLQKRRETPCC